MRIFRATNTAALEYIKPVLRMADGVSKEQYLENLELWLVHSPQTIFLQLAFEGNELQAFMVSYLPPQVGYIFISQVWAKNEETAVQLFTRAVEWGSYLGRIGARMETESDHDGYSEKWGFKRITETRGLEFAELVDRRVGEGPVKGGTDKPSIDSSVLTGSLSSNDLHAEGDIRDRAQAQDEALQSSVEGKSESNG